MNSEDERVYGELKARTAIPVEADGLLWHYTSWEGLKGIIENREFWASHIAYLNDTEELAHGLKLFAEMIDERSHLPHLEQLKETLSPERRDETLNRIETYTVSFSHKFDDLAQWRGYSGSPSSRFAVGFSPAVLERIGYHHNFDLKECLYTREQKREAYSVVIGYIEEIAKNLDLPEPEDARGGFTPRQVARRAYGKMVGVVQNFYAANVAARLKDESFKGEEEFRLIAKELRFDTSFPNASTRDYRTKGALVVPYVKLRIPNAEPLLVQPFTAVIVGPQAHRKLARGAVERLLMDQHVAAPVVESKVPFRDW